MKDRPERFVGVKANIKRPRRRVVRQNNRLRNTAGSPERIGAGVQHRASIRGNRIRSITQRHLRIKIERGTLHLRKRQSTVVAGTLILKRHCHRGTRSKGWNQRTR